MFDKLDEFHCWLTVWYNLSDLTEGSYTGLASVVWAVWYRNSQGTD